MRVLLAVPGPPVAESRALGHEYFHGTQVNFLASTLSILEIYKMLKTSGGGWRARVFEKFLNSRERLEKHIKILIGRI